MNKSEDILHNLFGSMPVFIFNINCYNRNLISVYSVNGKKIIFKKFNEKESAIKEKFFYKVLRTHCKIPQTYFESDDFIITEFIESSTPNLIRAVRDWARIHSDFLENKILEDKLMFKHQPRNLSDYVLKHKEIFGENTEKLREILSSKKREENHSTLIHGDLFGRNILTMNENNYYIDFEFSGSGHPTKDLSLLLLNHHDMKGEIIKIYRENMHYY